MNNLPVKFWACKCYHQVALGVEVYWSFGQVHLQLNILTWSTGVALGRQVFEPWTDSDFWTDGVEGNE